MLKTITSGGPATVPDFPSLLVAIERREVVSLPQVSHRERPAVVQQLAAIMAVLRHYGTRPQPWRAHDWRAEWAVQLGGDPPEA